MTYTRQAVRLTIMAAVLAVLSVCALHAADKTPKYDFNNPPSFAGVKMATEKELAVEVSKAQPIIDSMKPDNRITAVRWLLRSKDPRVNQLIARLDFSRERPVIVLAMHGPTVPPAPCEPDCYDCVQCIQIFGYTYCWSFRCD